MKLMKLNIQLFATTLIEKNQSVGSVGGGTNRFTFYEKVVVNSQNIENNTSNITITHSMSGNWGGFEGFHSPESIISIASEDGIWAIKKTTVVDSFTVGQTKVIGTWTGDVPHNSDGTLKLNFKCEFKSNTTDYYYLPADSTIVSGLISLATIPRKSSVGVSDTYIGSTASIIIDRKSQSFTHTLKWSCDTLNGTIVTKTANQTYAWTVPTSIYSLIPSAKQKDVKVICETFNGNTLVGTAETIFKAIVNEETNKPTVSATLTDTNETVSELAKTDGYEIVKFFSNVKTIITASAKNSATIKSYKVVCGDGKTATTATSTLNAVESGDFTITVIDSRGISNTIKKSLKMEPYVKLTSNPIIKRKTPTGSKLLLNVDGNYYVGPTSEKGSWNELNFQYRYREKGTTTWSGYNTLIPNEGGSSSNWNRYYLYNYELTGDFDYQKIYEFEFNVFDKLMTLTPSLTVKKGIPNHWWNKNSFNHMTDVYIKERQIIMYDVVDTW